MTNIIKQGSTLVIQGDAKSYPFKDGKISLPLNSLYFVIDESNVVSFKQVNDNNTLLSVNINDLQINGEQATKENLIEKFDAVANGSMGGSKLNAGTNITLQPQEDGSITISATGELTQSVEWTDVLNKPSDIVNITDKLAEKLDKTVYEADKTTFALKSEIPSIDNLATKEELSTKQDVLVSGTNIKTINGETLLGNGDIVIEGDVTKQYVDEQLALKADKTAIADMLTKTEASTIYATKEEIPSLENYLTIAQGDEKYQVKGNYITSELAEETYAKKTDIPDTSNFATKEELETKADVTALASKQDTLVSGVNIKTINGQTLLGEGNIEIQGGSGSGIPDAPSDDKLYGRKNGNWSEVIIPSTDNFATKQEISDMLTKSEAASTYQPKGEYLTSIPEEYVTDSELSAKGYATTSQLDSKLDVSTYTEDKAKFATKEELTEGLETKQDKGDYANRSDLANYLLTATAEETYQPIGDYATTTQLNSKADKTELENYVTTETAEATYAKKSEIPEEYTLPIATADTLGGIKVGAGLSINSETGVLSATGGGVADSVDWANVTSKPDDIVNITDKLAEKLDVSTYNSDKETFALKSEISDMLTKTEASETYQPKGDYLTEIPSEYITESELNDKGYKKIVYLTQTEYDELPNKEEGVLYVITDAAEVVIPDTSTFALKSEISDMATKTWVGEQGFLTSHQDISNLATKQEVTEGLETKQDKGNYITVETADGKYQPKGEYATTAQLANKVDNSTYTEDKATFALKSELTDFITASVDNLVNYYKKSETYTKGEVDSKISAITTINFEVVAELPESGEANKIYLVPNAEQGEQNVKDEYIWVDGKWEIIGSTKVDLSNYYNKGEVDSKLSAKVDLSTYTSDKETFALKSEISDMATQTWVTSQGYLTSHQDISQLATKQEVTEGLATKQDKGDYALKSELPDISNLATKDELSSKANTSDLSNYVTTVNAEATYAKKSEIPSLEGYLKTSTADEKYATKTELEGKVDDAEIADMLTKTEAASTYQPKGEYATTSQLTSKQDTLVSGENIKTVNGESILGEGNIEIQGGSGNTQVLWDLQTNSGNTEYITEFYNNAKIGDIVKYDNVFKNNLIITLVKNSYQELINCVLSPRIDSDGYSPNEIKESIWIQAKSNGTLTKGYFFPFGIYSFNNTINITKSDSNFRIDVSDDLINKINDSLTKTEASTTYALQTALQEALDRISALEAQIGVLSTQLDNINGEIIN